MIDAFKTLSIASEGLYKEKGSKFIAHAFPIENEYNFLTQLNLLKSQHPKARHFCYAYKYGLLEPVHRANDDGEPSGTAGKPIYGQIRSHELLNVGIIIIRYFGGTKLGASGLIHAYKEASIDALRNGTIVEKFLSNKVILRCGFDKMGHCLNVIKKMELEILDKSFTDQVVITLSIRSVILAQSLLSLKAKLLNVSEEHAEQMNTIGGYMIEVSDIIT